MEYEMCLRLFLERLETVKKTRTVHISQCAGMIAANDIRSEMQVPPFPKSAMDGYAVRSLDLQNASKEHPAVLKVIEEILAGEGKNPEAMPDTAVRIMTGAAVPEGYDAVVRQEDTDYGEKEVMIYTSVKPYQNYCKAGEDIMIGDLVIPANTRLRAVHAGLLASLGISYVKVKEPLKIAIISTGTELCPIEEELSYGKIHNSISYLLGGAIRKEGFETVTEEICPDDSEKIKKMIQRAGEIADIVITTGGVSVGKRDLVPGALEDLGAEKLFDHANIQPGTPTMGSMLNGVPVLSLSGNPYAALANFELYFWNMAAFMMEHDSYLPSVTMAELKSDYEKVNHHRRMIRARMQSVLDPETGMMKQEVWIPTSVHAASVIRNMTECNCMIDLPEGTSVKKGDIVTVRMLHDV